MGGQEKRLFQQIQMLQENWDLLNNKMKDLLKKKILETRPEEKLRLESLIRDTQDEIANMGNWLKELEEKLTHQQHEINTKIKKYDDINEEVEKISLIVDEDIKWKNRKKARLILFLVACCIAILGSIWLYVSPTTKIVITSPVSGTIQDERLEPMQFTTTVRGEIRGAIPSHAKYKLYILVCPTMAEGCWTQLPATTPQATWSSIARLGGTGEHRAKPKEQFRLYAVLSDNDLQNMYKDIKNLPPKAFISNDVVISVEK